MFLPEATVSFSKKIQGQLRDISLRITGQRNPNVSQNNRDSSLLLFATKNQENPDPIAEDAHGLAMGTEY